jgi:Flp pilus assembly protein TadG
VSSRRGQAAVEFALTLPLLLLLVLGIVDFGRVIIAANALTQGTRNAVRTATLNGSVDSGNLGAIRQQVKDAGSPVGVVVLDSQVSIDYFDTSATECSSVSLSAPCAVGSADSGGTYTASSPCPRSDCAAPLIGDVVKVSVVSPWNAATAIIQGVLPPSYAIRTNSAGTIEQ